MTFDRSVTALASTPQAPRRRYRLAYSTAAVARYSRATAQCLRSPPDLLPHRRCATALASKRPLAGLRLAGGYRVGCSATPEAAPLALSLLLSPSRQRRLLVLAGLGACCPPPAPSASLTAPSATSAPACSLRSAPQRPLRGKCFALLRIQHNSLLRKVGPVAAQAPLGDPTAARPAGSRKCSYVLRPYTANSVIWRCAWVQPALRDRWPTPNSGAALARLPARSLWPAPPAVSWWGHRPASVDFSISADAKFPCGDPEAHHYSGQ